MPCTSSEGQPPSVRAHLPEHAKNIFREAFNQARVQYAADPRRERIAYRVAWSAVKKHGYQKGNGEWIGP